MNDMNTYPKARGFTLVELLVIIVIIGVLAVFASARFPDRDPFEARGYYDELVSATRYAQRYAVASGCTMQIRINANSYALTTQDPNCGFGTTVQRPGGGSFAANAPAGVTVSGTPMSHRFDAYGDLVAGGGNVTVQGGGSALAFTVTAGSGYVDTP